MARKVISTESVDVWDVRFQVDHLDVPLEYQAIVPKDQRGETFPVLYLLHGANSGPDEILAKSEVARLAVQSHLIVIMPEAGFSYYTNAKHKSGAHWEDAVAFALPMEVESQFPVLKGAAHTGIAGISMGGYGAVKLALKHPEKYGFVGSLSGPFDITQRPASLKRWQQTWRIWTTFGITLAGRKNDDVFQLAGSRSVSSSQQWLLACGQEDPLYGVNKRFAREMRYHGVNLNFLSTGGGHDWNSWNQALPQLFHEAAQDLR